MIERLTPAEIMSIGQVDIAHALIEIKDAEWQASEVLIWHIVKINNMSKCNTRIDTTQTYYQFKSRPNQGMHINKYCPKCLDARIAELIEMLRNELNYA